MSGFKDPLLQNPENDSVLIFSTIPPENQSYWPKIGDTGQKSKIQPGGAPKSEPNHPEKAPELGFNLSTEKGLKASLNPAKVPFFSKLLHV